MPFAAALRKSLEDRGSEVPAEFRRGDSLEDVLNRHLMTVEQMGGDDVYTCILLLSPDGKRLSVAAAPSIPTSYCRSGDSFEIGLSHGSCAAAAYLGRPVYSIDIETDPIWADFRGVALKHGFRSCWSTPILNSCGAIIGTFAILHKTMGMPTHEEIEAIGLITEHVADAIMWSRDATLFDRTRPGVPRLRLVSNNPEARDPARLATLVERLLRKAADLERYADCSGSEPDARILREAAEIGRKLAADIQTGLVGPEKPAS